MSRSTGVGRILLFDRVKETSTTTGTGTLTLAGAITGFRTFTSVVATGNYTYYAIDGGSTNEWEIGIGQMATSSTLSRVTVLGSSNAGGLVNLSAGTKSVFISAPGQLYESVPRFAQLIQINASNILP